MDNKKYTKDDAFQTLNLINSWINNVDAKISFALAYVAVIIGFVFVKGAPAVFAEIANTSVYPAYMIIKIMIVVALYLASVVYLGYPIWSNTCPMAVIEFLESYDFKGKTVIPFCAHGTSGLGSSISDISAKIPEANVKNAFGVQRPGMDTPLEEAKASLSTWLNQLDISAAAPASGSSNILIAYFGLYGNADYGAQVDATSSASIVVGANGREGTTEAIASLIQNTVGGDKYLIQTVDSYPTDFNQVVYQNHQEQDNHVRPNLTGMVENLDRYDIVFIGYPIWSTTIPTPVATFLEQNDLSGKTVIPFCTHDGYGAGRSTADVRALCPQSEFLDSFAITAEDVSAGAAEVEQWLDKIGIKAEKKQDNTSIHPLRITIGDEMLEGYLNNSPEAQQFMAMLPQTITMGGFGGREYYGGLSGSISVQRQGKYSFEDGEITYCPANNTAAIFYAQTAKPNLTMEVFSMGKVTSDLSIFDRLDSRVEITFELGGS